MEINVKQTKMMVITKTGNVCCKIMVDGTMLEQMSQYKYLGSWITDDNGRCDLDVKIKIAMAKDAFWKHKELLRKCLSASKEKNNAVLYLTSAKILV